MLMDFVTENNDSVSGKLLKKLRDILLLLDINLFNKQRIYAKKKPPYY